MGRSSREHLVQARGWSRDAGIGVQGCGRGSSQPDSPVPLAARAPLCGGWGDTGWDWGVNLITVDLHMKNSPG